MRRTAAPAGLGWVSGWAGPKGSGAERRHHGAESLEGELVGLKRSELPFGADEAESAEKAAAAGPQDEGEEVAPVAP